MTTIKTNAKISMNMKGFEDLRKGLKKGQYVAVGVFGDHKAQRTDDSINNVELAILQVFGSITNNIPPRDFIFMPLKYKRAAILKFMATPGMRDLVLSGNVKKALQLLGVFAENVIQEAFDTGGFGKWAPNAPATIAAKGSDKPLINEGELRKAVWSKTVGA